MIRKVPLVIFDTFTKDVNAPFLCLYFLAWLPMVPRSRAHFVYYWVCESVHVFAFFFSVTSLCLNDHAYHCLIPSYTRDYYDIMIKWRWQPQKWIGPQKWTSKMKATSKMMTTSKMKTTLKMKTNSKMVGTKKVKMTSEMKRTSKLKMT